MAKQLGGGFKFRRTDHIGAAGAEEDLDYLSCCFVDTGNLALLQNLEDHRQIMLGRAGSGKTALLEKLRSEEGDSVITIDPENLALTYVSNSTILRFFEELGVNLDPFFKLLWRHVLTVEILDRHFKNVGPPPKKSLIEWLQRMFSGSSRKHREMREAIEYLQQWGERFWEHTEFRVKEITQKLEDTLVTETAVGLKIRPAKLSASLKNGQKISEEQRAQLITRGQKVVAEAQVQDLAKVIGLLDSVLDDRQRKYYVVIDKLDENWVEERLRYKLIMQLIVTAKDFIKVQNAKIIVALRRDLIERVFRLTRDSGFQEEKYQSLYLPLTWRKEKLIEVLDRRIGELVSRRYTRQSVTHKDLLPKNYKKQPITDFICSISTRPRDIIAFFNECICVGVNLSRLSITQLKMAEAEYSRLRLRAVADEWSADFPSLLDFTRVLHGRPPSFKIGNITEKKIEDTCLNVAAVKPSGVGILEQNAMKVVDLVISAKEFKFFLIRIFFRIGLVGLKLKPYETESWTNDQMKSISIAELSDQTSIVVHPMYCSSLGIVKSGRKA